MQLRGSWTEDKSQRQLDPTTNYNMPAIDGMEFVKKHASAGKHRFLAYESKQLAILGEISNSTFGLRSKLLSFEGCDTLTQRETFLKIFLVIIWTF